jgi:hypothetical protein
MVASERNASMSVDDTINIIATLKKLYIWDESKWKELFFFETRKKWNSDLVIG